jgi:hypothetical protein
MGMLQALKVYLCLTLASYFIIWRQWNNLVFNVFQWPIEKTHQVIWDALQGYDEIKWQRTLADLEKALDVAHQDVLNEFDLTLGGGVKGLIVIRSNLVGLEQFSGHLEG